MTRSALLKGRIYLAKKESFVKGTLILAGAALLVRLLGIAQRVPLEHAFGDLGNAAYGIANNVYLMLLTVASGGIPSTLSKMVSEKYALNKPHEAKRIYHAALIFSGIMGVVVTLALYIIAPYYAAYTKVPQATLAIRAIAPALLIFPTIAMMRGYFQGQGNMTASGISQIVEQILRVITAIGIAFVMLHLGYSDEWLAAGASFGSVFGSVGAFGVMLVYSMKLRSKQEEMLDTVSNEPKVPFSSIYMSIFKLSIPIVLTSLAVTAVNTIDTTMVKGLLLSVIGEAEAEKALAYLASRAQMVAGIPSILAIALSTSLIPVISAAYTRKDEKHLTNQVTLAMRISILTGLPMVIMLGMASYSVNGLLFKTLDGSEIMGLLTLMSIFQITMMTSNSILLGIGKPNLSMVHVGIGLIVKIIGNYTLSPLLGIYGVIISTGLCFLVITCLNIYAMKKFVPFKLMGDRWISLIISVIVLAGVTYGLNQLGIQMVHIMHFRVAFFLTCMMVGIGVLIVYPILLIMLNVIRKDELDSYPRLIRKLVSPIMRIKYRVRG